MKCWVEGTRTPDSSSGVSDQQSLGSSPVCETCVLQARHLTIFLRPSNETLSRLKFFTLGIQLLKGFLSVCLRYFHLFFHVSWSFVCLEKNADILSKLDPVLIIESISLLFLFLQGKEEQSTKVAAAVVTIQR